MDDLIAAAHRAGFATTDEYLEWLVSESIEAYARYISDIEQKAIELGRSIGSRHDWSRDHDDSSVF